MIFCVGDLCWDQVFDTNWMEAAKKHRKEQNIPEELVPRRHPEAIGDYSVFVYVCAHVQAVTASFIV